MCDTLVALGNSTVDGSVIFAKNSDRQPNEPHVAIRVPRRIYPNNSKLKCTYIEIDQMRETYEVLLLKPSWIWGAEMGANEFGLNIGNEAVFTKEKQGPPSLLGMDMVRLALERCKTSDEALHLIIELLARYGQGGNCGYEKDFYYHNSFLIADPTSAWVLETAGEYWAAQKVKDVRSISNRLSIEKDFDLAHPGLINHAISKGWCKSEADFNFARCYSDPLITHFSGSRERYASCSLNLEKNKGLITVENMMEVLRQHEPRAGDNPFTKSSLKSVCMHGGFIFGDHTTGSYVASLTKRQPTYWITGSSTPCISVFKPYWMVDSNSEMIFNEEHQDEAVEFWRHREQLHRLILENKVVDLDDYLRERNHLEFELLQRVQEVDIKKPDHQQLLAIMNYALAKEKALLEQVLARSAKNKPRIQGNPYFRYYWKKQNSALHAHRKLR